MKTKRNKKRDSGSVRMSMVGLSQQQSIFLLMLVWSAVALLLLSPDSPLHGPWGRVDSAIFFTSGKALMNGLRPYVEFSDSKGPLLWLIYGIGYLLSPRSYTGVYVVSVFWYAGIFYYNFKTALIFLTDERRAMAVTLLMTVAYFWPWFHFEVRAEDFATLPVAISLYHLSRLLYTEEIVSLRRLGLVLGGCFMALVMIKYNIAAMQSIIILVALWHCWCQRRSNVLPLTGWLLVGATVVALPFIGFLWLRGAVPAFIDEYFLNTLRTVAVSQMDGSRPSTFLGELIKALGESSSLALLMFIAYGGWMLALRLPSSRYVPLLIGLCFFVLATPRNLGYYYGICHIFIIYLLIWVVSLTASPYTFGKLAAIVGVVIGWSVWLHVGIGSKLREVPLWDYNKERMLYEHLSDVLDGSNKARVLNLYWSDDGFGLRHESLPAGRYWTHQYGSTPEMEAEHVRPMESCQADYVIVNDEQDCMRKGWIPGRIMACGYVRCYRDTCPDGRQRAIYKKAIPGTVK